MPSYLYHRAPIGYTRRDGDMIYTREVRQHVERYLTGSESLRELVLWLAAEGWELREKAPEAIALDAIRRFDLALGEFTGGHISQERLNERFRQILDTLPETTWTNVTEPTRQSSTSAHTEFAEAHA
jgi:hypothetical protein